jgi:hypothetical protein
MKRALPLLSLVSAILLSGGTLRAEKTAPVDPAALALLKGMSTTLAQAKSFTFRTSSILEVPSSTGQFITLYSVNRYALQRPDKLRAIQGGDAPAFDFYYDGSTVSASAPLTKVYSTTKAPATLDAMLPDLRTQTGIHLHITPFLYSDPYQHLVKNLQSAVIVGKARVHGVLCDHLAFRSPGVNWELWISSGSNPLPYRVAATYTDKPNFPRKFIEFSHWNLHPSWLWKSLFVFRKPAGESEVPFALIRRDAAR